MTSKKKLLISKQSDAENDQYLLECFHDEGYIEQVVKEKYAIVSGRKGAGKTALAKFTQYNHAKYNIDFAQRFSLGEAFAEGQGQQPVGLYAYILVVTAKILLQEGVFETKAKNYWEDFLTKNGLMPVESYESFGVWKKKKSAKLRLSAIMSILGGEAGIETEEERSSISDHTSHIASALVRTIPEGMSILIFIDDISDQLDGLNKDTFDLAVRGVQDLLLNLQRLNGILTETGKGMQFVCCVRDDLWSVMQSSNTNKLRSNSLHISWNENSTASLLVRRLPYFQDNLAENLKNPVMALKHQFPDEVFADNQNLLLEIGEHQSKFYSYLLAITFNRPRDFLQFCKSIESRLSEIKPIEAKNLHAGMSQYSVWLLGEVKDEIHLIAQDFGFSATENSIVKFLIVMNPSTSENGGIKYSHLRQEVGKILGKKSSHRETAELVEQLWRYGVIGIRDSRGRITFAHTANEASFPSTEEIKGAYFILHSGLSWAIERNRF